MPPFDRQEADRLLTRLLDLPSGDRTAALDAECDDDALRGAVLRLLRAAEAPHSLVDPESEWTGSLWEGLAREVAERETPLAPGTLVGPYRILEEIERGGMAVVYRAERFDGELERQVAIKVLKLGLDTEEVVRRFEQERQILADLDHPNIARLYDAGRTEDGRPYFVMELVEGLPIDRYCDQHRLSIDERLELFGVVAGAVEYAHQNLVVHRDLKSSNILVHRTGEVKLLDFGIARLLDMESGGGLKAPPTRTLVRMMTPEFASPEQVRGERVTTASDVYQLGLLLYELLTGRRPYAVSDRGPGEIERTICHRMPARPSSVVSQQDAPGSPVSGATADVYRARRTSPARLRRRLRGDLDNIVLQALRKEPERRYRTADRLAQDIRRHLQALPVTARADTWIYRGRKFLARHAIGVTASALLLIAAAGVAGFHTARIRSERDRAAAEAAKAEQVSRFLTGLFADADPRRARGSELTARELLDRGVEQVDRELATQPEVRADVLHVLSRTYMELGVHGTAEQLLTKVLELRRLRFGPQHAEVAEAVGDLGLLRFRQGEYVQARERLEEAVRDLEVSRGSDAPELVDVLRYLGTAYWRLGEREKGIAALERALAIQRRVAGEDSEAEALILHGMGAMLFEMDALERAEALYERALAIYERELGADHPFVGNVLMDLANARVNQGKLDGVEAIYRRALDIQRSAYGLDHVRVGKVLNNLGHFLTVAERNDEAVEVLQRSLEVHVEALGPAHPEVAYPLASLGDAHLAERRLREALHNYRRGVAIREPTLAGRRFDPLLFHGLVRSGHIEVELGRETEAERILNRAVEMWSRAPDAGDSRLVPALVDLGRWLARQERCSEAVPMLERAVLPPSVRLRPHPSASEAENLLAECRSSG